MLSSVEILTRGGIDGSTVYRGLSVGGLLVAVELLAAGETMPDHVKGMPEDSFFQVLPDTEHFEYVRRTVDLEVIIPAYNEAARIRSTLERTVDFLAASSWSSGVVIVDNGSSDDTSGVVRRTAKKLTADVPVSIIGCARPGKGAAVRRGLLSSRSRFVGFFDADLATPVETLTEAMHELGQGAGAVIGSRHVPGSTFVRSQSFGRQIGGAAFRLLSRTVVSGVRDTQCGFKFFERGTALRALVGCKMDGFAFDVELLSRVQSDGGRIVEIPVSWTDDARSTFRPLHDGIASFGAILRMQRLPRHG